MQLRLYSVWLLLMHVCIMGPGEGDLLVNHTGW